MPIFSFTDDKDPIAFWKATYPDSDGVEALSILITILETGFVHVDARHAAGNVSSGRISRACRCQALTPEQKVELFRIVTGADYKDMLAFGAYAFYRARDRARRHLAFLRRRRLTRRGVALPDRCLRALPVPADCRAHAFAVVIDDGGAGEDVVGALGHFQSAALVTGAPAPYVWSATSDTYRSSIRS